MQLKIDTVNRVALLVALALAGAGYYLLSEYRERFEVEASGGPKLQVLMVTRNIGTDTRITRDMLGVRGIPRAFVDERHIPASELRAVIGARTSSALKATESLLWSDLDGSDRRARSLAHLVGVGKRAITIPASGESLFGGLLQPGDRVDALLTGNAGPAGTGTLPLAQNLLVLAVGAKTSTEAEQPADKSAQQRRVGNATVTLAVSLEQAQQLTLARQFGAISLVLRNPDDVRVQNNLPPVDTNTLLRARRNQPAGAASNELLDSALRAALRRASQPPVSAPPAPRPTTPTLR